ncbi:hypothetical protein CNMCM8812_001278 [Aspergillus fumigatus]|uniref:NADH-ubiquinone reductase complex 1 MLRQ subunit n=1 Tax=Aspergillus fumigatus (strain ATCC MYA-4609 / CBS 101355 / FGSC A1100 / Af293) TaxID=330879 RepID=Q4X0M2_ASPFU|nr:conserved hypothetical protein [Aspergillus fumigatus Af293]KAF4258051.1 hypothetical protein CNMCM8714_002536 [Aspergillus fumigatus]EAL93593.2 conserved hypothetical protein [Aspergillus fumigatus Af293]KAF4270068.1 hypothetical protein CNMCM8812_001278 [Aspergillus fumigatus]KAF4277670.1 hypothetical protein CNMCM8057_002498 [Aspergillus fumigatus]KAJ8166679.1 hypothetical protein LV155_002223 [Aspergillus fumigatus]
MRQDFLNTRTSPVQVLLPSKRPVLSFRHHIRSSHPTTTTTTTLSTRHRSRHRHVPYSCSEDAGLSAFCFPSSSHTISQRLRTLKRVPPELIPLGIVLSVAVGAAIYSSTRKLMTDKTLRLSRNKPEDREH